MKNVFLFLFLSCAGLNHSQTNTIVFQLDLHPSENTTIDLLKFYISLVELQFDDGTTFHEQNSFHLLDIEDKSTCTLNLKNVPNKRVDGIRFTIGTDSVTNVSGALDGDLDPIKGMYWAWNSGYVNFKMEGSHKKQNFEYHIGGYISPNATARKVEFNVNNSIRDSIVVNVDVLAFLSQIDVGKTHSVLIPGKTASELATIFQTAFSIHE